LPEYRSLPACHRHLENCEICSAILDSTRNNLVLTADDRIFELPAGHSKRPHALVAREIRGGNHPPEVAHDRRGVYGRSQIREVLQLF
jgi:hypothetical protein